MDKKQIYEQLEKDLEHGNQLVDEFKESLFADLDSRITKLLGNRISEEVNIAISDIKSKFENERSKLRKITNVSLILIFLFVIIIIIQLLL